MRLESNWPWKIPVCCCHLVAPSCLALCDPVDYITLKAPLSMGFTRQEYWSELLFSLPGDLPYPEIKPTSAGRFSTTEPPGKPNTFMKHIQISRGDSLRNKTRFQILTTLRTITFICFKFIIQWFEGGKFTDSYKHHYSSVLNIFILPIGSFVSVYR